MALEKGLIQSMALKYTEERADTIHGTKVHWIKG